MTPIAGDSYAELAAPRAGSDGRSAGVGPWIALGAGVLLLLASLILGAFLPGREFDRLDRSLNPTPASDSSVNS